MKNLIDEEYRGKRNITPAMAVKMLKKHGQDVTEEQAKEILDFLYLLARITVNDYLKEREE
jgi:uncharacterized protein (DUF697 family)